MIRLEELGRMQHDVVQSSQGAFTDDDWARLTAAQLAQDGATVSTLSAKLYDNAMGRVVPVLREPVFQRMRMNGKTPRTHRPHKLRVKTLCQYIAKLRLELAKRAREEADGGASAAAHELEADARAAARRRVGV